MSTQINENTSRKHLDKSLVELEVYIMNGNAEKIKKTKDEILDSIGFQKKANPNMAQEYRTKLNKILEEYQR